MTAKELPFRGPTSRTSRCNPRTSSVYPRFPEDDACLCFASQLNDNATYIASGDGRANDNNGVLPPDLGEHRPREEPNSDANGRSRDPSNENRGPEVRDRREQNAPSTTRDGRAEGESTDDDSFADVLDDLCSRHQSSSATDDFFAWLGM